MPDDERVFSHVHSSLFRSTWKARVWPSKSPRRSTMLKVCTLSSNSCFPPVKTTRVCCSNFDHVAFQEGPFFFFVKLFVFFLCSALVQVSLHCFRQNKHLVFELPKKQNDSLIWVELMFLTWRSQPVCLSYSFNLWRQWNMQLIVTFCQGVYHCLSILPLLTTTRCQRIALWREAPIGRPWHLTVTLSFTWVFHSGTQVNFRLTWVPSHWNQNYNCVFIS